MAGIQGMGMSQAPQISFSDPNSGTNLQGNAAQLLPTIGALLNGSQGQSSSSTQSAPPAPQQKSSGGGIGGAIGGVVNTVKDVAKAIPIIGDLF